jgi:hypothetical protein
MKKTNKFQLPLALVTILFHILFALDQASPGEQFKNFRVNQSPEDMPRLTQEDAVAIARELANERDPQWEKRYEIVRAEYVSEHHWWQIMFDLKPPLLAFDGCFHIWVKDSRVAAYRECPLPPPFECPAIAPSCWKAFK